jgi:hypothetical protein
MPPQLLIYVPEYRVYPPFDMKQLADCQPLLPADSWTNTQQLHRWTQLVDQTRLALKPMLNHWWEVPLFATPLGFSTGPMPFAEGKYELVFNFRAHELRVHHDGGRTRQMMLEPHSVADFLRQYRALLREASIATIPVPAPTEHQASIVTVFQIVALNLPFTISFLSHKHK